MSRLLPLFFIAASLVLITGCTTTTAGMLPAVGSAAAIAGSKAQTQQAWSDENVRVEEIKAQERKKVAAIQLDADNDIEAMKLAAQARATAAARAEADLRQYQLGIATGELGHSVETVTDSERKYQEEKMRRELLELELIRLKAILNAE